MIWGSVQATLVSKRRGRVHIMDNRIKQEEFEKLFNLHYLQVYKYIYKKISDSHCAEDLAMDSFVSCWEKFDFFDPAKASFQTWLYVIVNNKLKNYYRDKKDFDELSETIAAAGDPHDELIEAIHLTELREHLASALSELNETQRRIVILKHFGHKKSTEIAGMMGLSPGNVRIQLMRSLEKLRKYFDKNNIRWE